MEEKLMAAISLGGYDLPAMLGRIDTAWAKGEVTDEARARLSEAARDRARPEDSLPGLPERLARAEKAIAEAQGRLAALEAALAQGGGEGQEDAGDAPEPSAPPEYRQPTGAHDCYAPGDTVSWGGRVWECLVAGTAWDPGTYPAAWREVG